MAYALVSNKLIDLYTNNNSIVHCTPHTEPHESNTAGNTIITHTSYNRLNTETIFWMYNTWDILQRVSFKATWMKWRAKCSNVKINSIFNKSGPLVSPLRVDLRLARPSEKQKEKRNYASEHKLIKCKGIPNSPIISRRQDMTFESNNSKYNSVKLKTCGIRTFNAQPWIDGN